MTGSPAGSTTWRDIAEMSMTEPLGGGNRLGEWIESSWDICRTPCGASSRYRRAGVRSRADCARCPIEWSRHDLGCGHIRSHPDCDVRDQCSLSLGPLAGLMEAPIPEARPHVDLRPRRRHIHRPCRWRGGERDCGRRSDRPGKIPASSWARGRMDCLLNVVYSSNGSTLRLARVRHLRTGCRLGPSGRDVLGVIDSWS